MSYNLHVALSGFPTAIFSLLLCFEGYNAWKGRPVGGTRVVLMSITLVFSFCTYFSGYLGLAHAKCGASVASELIETHRTWGKLFLIAACCSGLLAAALCVAKERIWILGVLYASMLVLTLLISAQASRLGGSLVFEHGVAVLPLGDCDTSDNGLVGGRSGRQ